jgi:hypothetical protein
VQLSEELREQMMVQLSAQHEAANTVAPVAVPAPNNAIVWPGAMQCAALAGAVSAAFTLVSFALPPVALLSFFWLISAPIVVLGVYSSRFRRSRITMDFGARLGALTGLAILIATTTLNTTGLVLQRYVFHSTSDIDVQITSLFTQMHTTIAANSGPASAEALHMLAIPEFRAGILLTSIGICLVLYLGFSSIAGAFAGYLRARNPR